MRDGKAPLAYLRRKIAVFSRLDTIEEIPLLAAFAGIEMNFVRADYRVENGLWLSLQRRPPATVAYPALGAFEPQARSAGCYD